MLQQKQLPCSKCGEQSAVNVPISINIKENPSIKDKVKDGSLFIWECPHCGTRNLISSQVLYHDPDQHLMIWLVSKDSDLDNQMEKIEKAISADEGLSHYTFRRVFDVGSLIEKVNIFDAGLDDTVIELCKWVTKQELAEKMLPEKARLVSDAPFKFYKIQGPDNEIVMTYPFEGQMQGVEIGFNVYEDCAGIINRNPSIKPAGSFPIVDASWVQMHIK